jgi:hypothetical protein
MFVLSYDIKLVVHNTKCVYTSGAYRFDRWYNHTNTDILIDYEQHWTGGPQRRRPVVRRT